MGWVAEKPGEVEKTIMQPSIFNNSVPLPDDSVFLMNTFTDAQLVVSTDVAALLDRLGANADAPLTDSRVSTFSDEEQSTLDQLTEHGFVVKDRATERQALEQFFVDHHENTEELHLTVLTTLQCNFACDYCLQGDHGEWNKSVNKMSLSTAEKVGDWLSERLDTVKPKKLALTFFGGEPLLNLEVLYLIADRAWEATQDRGMEMEIHVITNGLLLTPDVAERLKPLGLGSFKVTLDGDRESHDRMRPLRGGQGTFDKIIENIRQVAPLCNISIGGNFDEQSVDSYPALLDFLKEQSFADSLVKVAFKPIIATEPVAQSNGLIPLTAVDASGKALGGGCMTAAGAGGGSPCDTCHFLDEKMSFLREETTKRGFPTLDGVHMGPCEIHAKHAYTVGTDGSLFACPGFATELGESVGHIDSDLRDEGMRPQAARRFEELRPWDTCGDCSFIPVCAGGCSVAAHNELGNMNEKSCHKTSFESAMVSMAHTAAGVS
jgi:uncharacterized protein